jgi:hypothetical protein
VGEPVLGKIIDQDEQFFPGQFVDSRHAFPFRESRCLRGSGCGNDVGNRAGYGALCSTNVCVDARPGSFAKGTASSGQ